MRIDRFRVKRQEFVGVMRNEYRHIFSDGGVILVMVVALLLYATAYSLAYKNEVMRDIPIAVVDQSGTAMSRKLIGAFDMQPNIRVSYMPASMDEAQSLFFGREVYGVVYIPGDFERTLLRGERSIVGVYLDASYFLMYRQVFVDVVTGLTSVGAQFEAAKLMAAGASPAQAAAAVQPVQFRQTNLFNPYGGYGSFVMPAIIIIIIQQTLLIGIGMIGGTWREFGLYSKLCVPGERRLSTLPVVLGKTAVYLSIYAVTVGYILTAHYRLFHFPMNGEPWDIVLFMIPFLLSCMFLGIAVSTLFRYRENSLLFLLWTSIPMLLVSGASIPKAMIPQGLYTVAKIFPGSSGVEGFLRLQTMGASLREVSAEYHWLWILTAVYFLLACIGIRYRLNHQAKP